MADTWMSFAPTRLAARATYVNGWTRDTPRQSVKSSDPRTDQTEERFPTFSAPCH